MQGAPHKAQALIFDMDGTMVDSMPWHAKAWVEYGRRKGLKIDIPHFMRRTTGRTAFECACELMGREVTEAEGAEITHAKESIYRELFGAAFREVAGFGSFAKAAVAHGYKIAVGTAGDRHNIAFTMSQLKMDPQPRAASACRRSAASSSKTRPSASRPHDAAGCARWPSAAPTAPANSQGRT